MSASYNLLLLSPSPIPSLSYNWKYKGNWNKGYNVTHSYRRDKWNFPECLTVSKRHHGLLFQVLEAPLPPSSKETNAPKPKNAATTTNGNIHHPTHTQRARTSRIHESDLFSLHVLQRRYSCRLADHKPDKWEYKYWAPHAPDNYPPPEIYFDFPTPAVSSSSVHDENTCGKDESHTLPIRYPIVYKQCTHTLCDTKGAECVRESWRSCIL